MIAEFYHEPVMLKEVVDSLLVSKTGVYVDGTVGGAGHAYSILKETEALLVGIDCDEDALQFAEQRLAEFGSRKILVKENFANLDNILKNLNIKKVDGVLLDLGVSSRQLDASERGFSFSQQAPLDMRMDRGSKPSAYDIVNTFTQSELEKIIRLYGEEKMAARIARAISKRRREAPISTTTELASIAASCMPGKFRWQKIHPATRTFQAIRIAVNHELDHIKPAIHAAADVLKPGGRLCVISFHSLEDRIVKNEIHSLEGGCMCPPGLPVCVCQREAKLRNLSRKPITPSPEEINANPRARSAKLRVAGRI
ncbi:MAG: 16S rRNA (cytosine(1402)-N(4))-methyltransferase RsmH [Smithella sp.]